jgi:hypothetical protein
LLAFSVSEDTLEVDVALVGAIDEGVLFDRVDATRRAELLRREHAAV